MGRVSQKTFATRHATAKDSKRAGLVMKEIGAAVIGGGQAGVCLSYYLGRAGVDHLVFERDRPFASWRNRWEGFRTNTPNWMNLLPMAESQPALSRDPDGFATRDELVRYFDACLAAARPPLVAGSEVTRVAPCNDGRWIVETARESYRARAVAVCNGAMSVPRFPRSAADLPKSVPQLHSSQFKSPAEISTKQVLVVGTASSGVQIARLLCESMKFERVHVALSKVLTLPGKMLGVPIHRFIHRLGLFDVRTHSAIGRLLYSNLEGKGDPIMRPTPRDLSRKFGLALHGRFEGVAEGMIRFADGSALPTDDLTVVWCTGFRPDYRFVEVPDSKSAFLASGHPRHSRGVSDAAEGLYFVGLRYQHTVASHDIYGVAGDAEYVAKAIARQLDERVSEAAVSA
jgi:putative flavoprotein involved in K+ transport